MQVGWKLAFGLDVWYEVLSECGFPMIVLQLAYFPLMTLFLFLRSLKNEVVIVFAIFASMVLGFTLLGLLLGMCCFLGQGIGVYSQRFPEDFHRFDRFRGPPNAEGGQAEVKAHPISQEQTIAWLSAALDDFFGGAPAEEDEQHEDDAYY